MNKKEVEIGIIELTLFLLFIAVLYLFIHPAYTGLIVYEGEQAITFTNPSDFTYNNSLIEIANNEVKLKLQETISTYLVYNYTNFNIQTAQRDGMDITSYLLNLDGSSKTLDSNQEIRIEAPQNLQNSDIISFYLIRERASNVNICSNPNNCEILYGTFYYPSASDGYYNVTISNLVNQTNEFYVLTDAKIKIDYLTFYRTTSEEITETNYSYLNASIETPNYNLNRDTLTGFFSSESTLNGQQILYYYTLDYGNYNLITNNNISLNNASLIKFKADLITNETSTPILSSISLAYNYDIPCIENWVANYENCQIADEQLKYYIDENNCKTFNDFPLDNGTYIACDYCTPNWIETKTSCNPDDTIIGWYGDLNYCYAETNLESDNNIPLNNTYVCDYIISTEFSNINLTDLSKIENLTLETQNGIINFQESISIIQSTDLDSNIEITNTSIFLNSTALPAFNKSAIIQLKNLNFNNPIISINNETCSECNKLSYENNTLTFTVPHFTLYSIEEGPYCGDSICNNLETCSSCSVDCGSCLPSQASSSSGSREGAGGSSSFTRPEVKTEAKPLIEKAVEQEKPSSPMQEENFEEFQESTPLEAFTGQTTAELETSAFKTKMNRALISVIVLNILFIIYRVKFRKKDKLF